MSPINRSINVPQQMHSTGIGSFTILTDNLHQLQNCYSSSTGNSGFRSRHECLEKTFDTSKVANRWQNLLGIFFVGKYIIKLVDKSKTVCTCWCAINIQVFIWMELSVIPNFLWSYSSVFKSACTKIRIFNKKCPH